jgi:glycosyltransferase involved in cell wall biosynthesis
MQMKSRKGISIHVWVPDLLASKGGIQTYSSFLLRALHDLEISKLERVFIKNEKYPDGPLPSIYGSPNLSCMGVGVRGLQTTFFSLQSFWYSFIEKPDLIITTHINFSPLARYIKEYFGIPYWVITHGIDAWGITDYSLKAALRKADKILAVSRYTRHRLLKEQNLDEAQVKILPNTFNEDQFVIRSKPEHLLKKYQLHRDQPVVLTVARLDNQERYKGYDVVLQSLLSVREVIPDVHYLLVGKGKDHDRIVQLVRELGLEKNVTLTGFVPDQELCDHYNLCDVYVMPSKKEGFGIVYLEALACGKPVVAGNRDGSVDALCDGELGILVDPDDTNKIADELVGILKHENQHPMIYQPELLRERIIVLASHLNNLFKL